MSLTAQVPAECSCPSGFFFFFWRVIVSSDHQQTDTSEQADKFSSVRDTTTEVQAAQEEEEEEGGDENGGKNKEMTEGNSRGTNWRRGGSRNLDWGEFEESGEQIRKSQMMLWDGVVLWMTSMWNAEVKRACNMNE